MQHYNYEQYENGLKGSMGIHGDGNISHLSIPIGIIVVREQPHNIHSYEDATTSDYDTIDEELFDKLLEKCSQKLGKDNTRKNKEIHVKTKKNKKH